MNFSAVWIGNERRIAEVIADNNGVRLLRPVAQRDQAAARTLCEFDLDNVIKKTKSKSFSDREIRQVRAPMVGGCSRHQRIR